MNKEFLYGNISYNRLLYQLLYYKIAHNILCGKT